MMSIDFGVLYPSSKSWGDVEERDKRENEYTVYSKGNIHGKFHLQNPGTI